MAGNRGPEVRSQKSEDRSKDAPRPIHVRPCLSVSPPIAAAGACVPRGLSAEGSGPAAGFGRREAHVRTRMHTDGRDDTGRFRGRNGAMSGQPNEEMTTYAKERQEAQMQTIHESMERALGRSRTPLDQGRAMGEYDPHDWIRW